MMVMLHLFLGLLTFFVLVFVLNIHEVPIVSTILAPLQNTDPKVEYSVYFAIFYAMGAIVLYLIRPFLVVIAGVIIIAVFLVIFPEIFQIFVSIFLSG